MGISVGNRQFTPQEMQALAAVLAGSFDKLDTQPRMQPAYTLDEIYAGTGLVPEAQAVNSPTVQPNTQYYPKDQGQQYGYNAGTGTYEIKQPGQAYASVPAPKVPSQVPAISAIQTAAPVIQGQEVVPLPRRRSANAPADPRTFYPPGQQDFDPLAIAAKSQDPEVRASANRQGLFAVPTPAPASRAQMARLSLEQRLTGTGPGNPAASGWQGQNTGVQTQDWNRLNDPYAEALRLAALGL